MPPHARGQAARQAAADWARHWIARSDWAILDSETTGLGPDAEIIELALLDSRGVPLLDTLVRPLGRIPADASRVHGITDADVAVAPAFPAVAEQLARLLSGRAALIYNADYDLRLLRQSAARHGLALPRFTAECVMLRYADYWGEPGRDGYRWQRLDAARARHGIPGGAHRARDDCRAVLGLLHVMAGGQPPPR